MLSVDDHGGRQDAVCRQHASPQAKVRPRLHGEGEAAHSASDAGTPAIRDGAAET